MTEPRAAVPHAEILAAAVDAAEESGFLPRGGVYGTLTMPDPVSGACCDGSAVKGPQYCTCWTPRFDLEQQPPVEGEPGTRTAMCADCAYRPGSPERQGDERYNGDPEFLDRIVVTGEMFFCHAGIRQAVKLVHRQAPRLTCWRSPRATTGRRSLTASRTRRTALPVTCAPGGPRAGRSS
jgi:hypothetical protein